MGNWFAVMCAVGSAVPVTQGSKAFMSITPKTPFGLLCGPQPPFPKEKIGVHRSGTDRDVIPLSGGNGNGAESRVIGGRNCSPEVRSLEGIDILGVAHVNAIHGKWRVIEQW